MRLLSLYNFVKAYFYTLLYVERRRKMSTIADDTRGGMRNVWIITAA